MTSPNPPRFLGGYGPALVVGVVILLVSAYVPSISRDEPLSSTELAAASQDGTTVDADTTGTLPDTGTTVPGATGATGTGTGTGGGKTTNKPKTGAQGGGSGGAAGKPGTATVCTGQQVKGDPYSPPCYKWNGGDNGGATSLGVTGDTITITLREGTFDKGVIDAVSKAALKQGASNFLAGETPELVKSTIEGLVEYFNKYYEFYGRKLKLQWVAPKGDVLGEILGGGQEGAEADAITVANEIKAFADVTAISPPYADALARRGVIAIGAPYMSQQWLTARAPYEWSNFTDCDTIVRTVTSYYNAKLGGKAAAFAGGDLKGKPRKVGIVAPDSDWFQSCVANSINTIRGANPGDAPIDPITYKLDLNAMAPQAYSVVPRLVSDQVTTVLCACDPLMLLFLTAKAREQGYQPEWVETGVAFSDQDAVAQIFDQQSWNGAFGISFGGDLLTLSGGPGYRAFQAARGQGAVPSKTVEALFYQIQLLAVGIQMAGPNLTPKTFESGMFKYPPTNGPAGTWDFGPGDYTGPGDAREVFYSAGSKSSATGQPGAWIDPNGGKKRYRAGEFPPGDPATGR